MTAAAERVLGRGSAAWRSEKEVFVVDGEKNPGRFFSPLPAPLLPQRICVSRRLSHCRILVSPSWLESFSSIYT